MSVAERKGTTLANIPSWEAELWSYVSGGDGIRCPLLDQCQLRKSGSWCLSDNRERINRLLDERKFNLQHYDFIKTEAGKQCRLVQLVERLANTYLKMGNVPYPPVSTGLVMLFDPQRTVEVRQLPLKAYHGAIWYQKDGWVIQVKDADAAPTMRFTVFHEAFHILAHCRAVPVFRKRGSVAGSFNELLADCFAAWMLMPREWLREKWAEVKDLDRMAEIFVVPKSAMCIVLRRMDLI